MSPPPTQTNQEDKSPAPAKTLLQTTDFNHQLKKNVWVISQVKYIQRKNIWLYNIPSWAKTGLDLKLGVNVAKTEEKTETKIINQFNQKMISIFKQSMALIHPQKRTSTNNCILTIFGIRHFYGENNTLHSKYLTLCF